MKEKRNDFMNKKLCLYIHGQGGNADEAKQYRTLFEDYDVVGLNYKHNTPWDTRDEFNGYFDKISEKYQSVTLVANSIGAYFAMNALRDKDIEKAFFISPIVNMEKLIKDMMMWAGVSEDELKNRGEIQTDFGETLSWEYLCYVKQNPILWSVPTHILYGEKDNLTSFETISEFAKQINATLTVMENGEHWFHTDEQMKFLYSWIGVYND